VEQFMVLDLMAVVDQTKQAQQILVVAVVDLLHMHNQAVLVDLVFV
jgi:hypothetical protein